MLLPPRKLVGLLIVSTWPTACALPGMVADYEAETNAGQSSIGLVGGNAGNGGNSASSTGATSGGTAGQATAGGSAGAQQTSTGATGTVGGTSAGGANSGGASSTGGAINGGATSTSTGATSGGGTTHPTGGNTGLGGASLGGATNATGGTSNPATGGSSNAGAGGKSTTTATGGTSNPATATGGTSNSATGGASNAGSGGTSTVVATGGSSVGGTSSTGGSSSAGGASSTPLVPTKITTGFYTSCAVKSDGTAYCWGTEYCGGLGNGSDGSNGNPQLQCGYTGWLLWDDYLKVTLQHSPVQVRGISNAVAIARGVNNLHNCVLRSSGTVSCWGWNVEGELGDNGSESWSTLPVSVKNLNNVVNVVVGGDHSCALLADATVKCWGTNVDGAIGNGDLCSSGSCSDIPATTVLVAAGTPLDKVSNIYSGGSHTCALRNDGSVWCWGYNGRGQLGNGTTDDGRFATRSNFPQALDVTTGEQFTCVRAVDNSLWCAGYNDYGGFGIDPPAPDRSVPIPTPVKSLSFSSPLVALTAGTYNTCAIVALVGNNADVAQCWGDNWTGQLGDGTVDSSLTPVSAVGMSNVTEIAADSNHTCAVKGGSVYCWGNNDAGQIGTTTTGPILEPTKVAGLQL